MERTIRFKLNGEPVERTLDAERKLLWVLRTDFGLTGAKYGCGIGFCGACTVLVDEQPVRSCLFPVSNVHGKSIVTIEGLAKNGHLHPIQKAFISNDALQCGFCTPGMILNAYALLKKNPKPTREEISLAMEHHLCRCGSHVRIIDAIQTAARDIEGGRAR